MVIVKTPNIFRLEERNQYEKDKKIKNQMEKMKVITARRKKPAPLHVDGVRVQYAQSGNVLGLRLTNFGIGTQITYLRDKGNRQLLKLKRFSCLPEETKLYLYKALLRPILEYPAVVLCTASRNATYTLQKVQGKALRWIYGRLENNRCPTNYELHARYNIEPINIRLHKLARCTWERLDRDDDPNLRNLERIAEVIGNEEHRWFPRSLPRALGPPPTPLMHKDHITHA